MTLNPIGWIGAALFVGGLIGIGMLIENLRQNYKLKRKDYTFGRKGIKPRKVPQEPEEWGISSAAAFEEACRRVVEESPSKFK